MRNNASGQAHYFLASCIQILYFRRDPKRDFELAVIKGPEGDADVAEKACVLRFDILGSFLHNLII